MGTIIELTGAELARFLGELGTASEQTGIYKLTFAIDGGVKVKVNEYTWSPPMGTERP